MNETLPSKYPQAPVKSWRVKENGRHGALRRGHAKNSNIPVAGPDHGSSFVVADATAPEEIFSPVCVHQGLFRRHAKGARKSLAVMRPDLGIDDPRRPLAVERVEDLLGGDAAHVLAGLAGDAGGMRARQHI